MKKTTYIIVYLILCSLFSMPVLADEEDRLARFKAVFVYYFIDYIHWPNTDTKKPFKIVLLGNSPLEEPLKEIASKRTVHNRKIHVQTRDTLKNLKHCDLIFLTQSKKHLINDLSKHVAKQNTLTISDTPGFAQQGVAINMVLVNGKLKFEINRQALQNAKLKASSQLLKLAILVNSEN